MSRKQHPVYGDPQRFELDFKGPKNIAIVSKPF